MKIQITVATILSCLALEASAFWRLPCRDRSSLQRIDPIISPGLAAGHVHAIHGPNTVTANATIEDLKAGSCSSCQVKQDMSAYWTPAMYFKDSSTGKLEVVPQIGGMLVYYLQRGDNVQAAPAGLRMLAGDPSLRDFPYRTLEKSHWGNEDRTEAALRQKAVGFNCLNYNEPANAALGLRAMPDDPSKCKDGLRAEVFFPSCWDGKRVDSSDHKDHMRYPSLMDDGTCPDTHPIRIVSLFFETIWHVAYFAGKKGEYVFANGDPLGYGYHGDFMNGWEQEVLEQAVKECRSPTGVVEECGVFEHYTVQEMQSCKVDHLDVEEDVVGPLSSLPGCNEITYGPDPATPGTCKNTPITPPKEEEEEEDKEEEEKPTYEDDVEEDDKVDNTPSIPVISIPVPTDKKPEFVATQSPVVESPPENTPPPVTNTYDNLVVVTVTEYTTVDVYASPEAVPSPTPVPKRRRHVHGAHHHHKF